LAINQEKLIPQTYTWR